jgi:formylglycine-generating enzyme required for sulfatase activity
MHTRILFAALFTLPLVAQARTTILSGPPALGATCYVRHQLPNGLAGHVAGFLWSAPFTGTVAVPLPGFTVQGLLRVDPSAFQLLGLSVTNGVSLPTMPLAVPATTALLGSSLDCQSFDLDPTATLRLAGNDVTLTVVQGPNPALNLTQLQPGTFLMGSTTGNANEQPVRQVTLSQPFWMGRFEVTQAQYQAVMGVNPSFFQGVNLLNPQQRPVETVSWNDAMAYCQALTAIEQAAGRVPAGYQYRLPTEAEWEYGCRAGTTTEWHTGASLDTTQANIAGAFLEPEGEFTNGQTWFVGNYAPNAFGLHDMHGNVAEWCLDSFGPYAPGAVTDPFVTGGIWRVLRGGFWHWGCTAFLARSAYRNFTTPATTWDFVGFRVVLAPALVP